MTISAQILVPGIESSATFTAGSTAAGFDVTDLKGFHRPPWRSAGPALHQTILGFTLAAAEQISSLAYICGRGVGSKGWRPLQALKARLRLGSGTLPAREKVIPDGVTTATNISWTGLGDHRDVDDDVEGAGVADYAETTTDGTATLRLTMATPAAVPATGAGLQVLRWRIEAPAGGDVTVARGVAKETGISSPDLTGEPATIPAGETRIVHCYWNASALDVASGVDLESVIDLTGGNVTTGGAKIHAADWYSLPVGGDFEGEWVRLFPLAMIGDANQGADLAASGYQWTGLLRYLPGGSPDALSADRGEIEFRDHENTSGYVEILWVPIGRGAWLDDVANAHESLVGEWSESVDHGSVVPARVLNTPARLSPELWAAIQAEIGRLRRPRVVFQAQPDLAAASVATRHLPRYCELPIEASEIPGTSRSKIGLKLVEVVD